MEIMEVLGEDGRRVLELSPAIKNVDGKPLTQEEFHEVLYEYFEEKGILTDMRAHLRSQMVHMLRDTALSKIITIHSEISPKLQALNLLIAEFLLNHRYHYTLSVLTTEVPLTNIFSNFANEFPTEKPPQENYKFPESDLADILATLSIPTLQQTLIQNAYATSNLSLLQIIFNTQSSTPTCDNLEDFVAFLQTSKTPPETTLKIIQHLKTLITKEINDLEQEKQTEIYKLQQSHQEETTKLQLQLKTLQSSSENDQLQLQTLRQTHDKDQQQLQTLQKSTDNAHLQLQTLQKSHEKEQRRLQHELETAKGNLKACAQNLQGKYKDLQRFEEDLKVREEKVKVQEKFLLEKDSQLQRQLEVLALQVKTFGDVGLQETNKVVGGQEAGTLQDKTMENITVENALLKTNVRDLQIRVGNLCEQNRVYLNRIQDLAVRTTGLMQELECSQRKVQELNGCRRVGGGGFTSAFRPLVEPDGGIGTRRNKYGIASYSGGGEEGSTMAPLTPRTFRHADLKRKKPPKKPTSSSTPSSSSIAATNGTDAVLDEARQRLINLQQESKQIDRHYQNITADNKALTDFQLNVATIRNNLSKIFQRQYQFPGTSSQFIPVNENILYTSNENRFDLQEERYRPRKDGSNDGRNQEGFLSGINDGRSKEGRFIGGTNDGRSKEGRCGGMLVGASDGRSKEVRCGARKESGNNEGRCRDKRSGGLSSDGRTKEGGLLDNAVDGRTLLEEVSGNGRSGVFGPGRCLMEEEGFRMFCGNEDRLKIKNLIADLPVRGNNFEYLVEVGRSSDESGRSSALVLATSFSTVEVSSEQSDGECKGLLVQRGPNGLMDMINLPCLLAFILEILLFK